MTKYKNRSKLIFKYFNHNEITSDQKLENKNKTFYEIKLKHIVQVTVKEQTGNGSTVMKTLEDTLPAKIVLLNLRGTSSVYL